MTVRSGCHMALIAAILFLPPAHAQADDRATLIPILSDSDSNRASIKVTRSGEREKAVPVLEIAGKTVRRMETADETGSGLLAPPAGVEGEGDKGQVDVGKLLTRHRSLLVREGPEGVSLGNAFDLVGDIRDALEKNRRTREKQGDSVTTRKTATGDGEPVSGSAEPAERPGTTHPEESRFRPGIF